MKYIIIGLILSMLILGGCTQKESQKYFEIVSEKQGSFHEIIILDSGEFFEKKGSENLSFDNQVIAGSMKKETAQSLTARAFELVKNQNPCIAGKDVYVNDIIYFDGANIARKCFYGSAEFNDLFSQSIIALTGTESNNNFFIHLIQNTGTNSLDYHLHSDGLVIITTYGKTNAISSATIKSISAGALNSLKTTTTQEILAKDANCSLSDSGYDYLEVQKDSTYAYYANCHKASKEKRDFYASALKILGEAK